MSTKIYNGYKIDKNALDINNLFEFKKEIDSRLKEHYLEKFYSSWFVDMVCTLDNLTFLDAKFADNGNCKEIDNILCKLFKSQESIPKIISSYMRHESLDISRDNINKNLSNVYAGMVGLVFLNKIKLLNDDVKVCNRCRYNFDYNSSCVLLNTNENILILVYGPLENLFEGILKSRKKKDLEFIHKYGLAEYHYWDNYDKPYGLSNNEWDNRRKAWSSTGVLDKKPCECGICIDFLDSEAFFEDLELNLIFNKDYKIPKKYLKYLSTFDMRIEALANYEYKNEYIKKYYNKTSLDELRPAEILEASEDFKKKLEAKDVEVMEKLNEKKDYFRNILLPINLDVIRKPLLSFCPHYLEAWTIGNLKD